MIFVILMDLSVLCQEIYSYIFDFREKRFVAHLDFPEALTLAINLRNRYLHVR